MLNQTQDLCKNSRVKLKKLRETYLASIKLKSQLKTLWMELISVKLSQEPDSKNSAMIYLKRLFSQSNKSLMIQEWRRLTLMK